MEKKKNLSEIKRIAKKRNNMIHSKYSSIVHQILAEERGATEAEKTVLDNLDREFARNERFLLMNEEIMN